MLFLEIFLKKRLFLNIYQSGNEKMASGRRKILFIAYFQLFYYAVCSNKYPL